MAAKASELTTPVQHIQHERFTKKEHGYRLWYLSLDSSGNIAVSGDHYSSRRTYIDLFSGKKSDSRDKLQLFYSKEFEKYSDHWYRYVSFLDKNVRKLVTCIGDKLEIIDTKNESKVLHSCRVNGVTCCLTVKKGQIFLGLRGSQTVLVFTNDLKKTKKIRIKGIQYGDWPWDLQVITDTVFVRTRYGRASSLSVYDGSFVSEYTGSTAMYCKACSIAVSEEINLVAVLWYMYRKKGIIVYSLDKNKPFLVFDVDDDVTRIRISDRDRMIITGNSKTGEIKMYDLEHEKTLDDQQDDLVCVTKQAQEQKKILREDLKIGELKIKELKGEKMRLTEALQQSSKQIEKLSEELEQMQMKSAKEIKTLTNELKQSKTESDRQIEVLREELKQSKTEADREIKILADELKQSKQSKSESDRQIQTMTEEQTQIRVKTSKKIEAVTKEIGQTQIKSPKERETLADELKQSKAEPDREIETLAEELKQPNKIKTIATVKPAQVKRKSHTKIEMLTEELEQTHNKSATEIETLREELKQIKQSKTESDRQIETLTERLKQTNQSKAVATEELTQVKGECHTKIKMLTEELEQSTQVLDLTKIEYANMMETLTTELNETKQKLLTRIKQLETTNKDLELTKQILKKTVQDRDYTKTELKQYHLDFAKESKALKEVQNLAKEVMGEQHKRTVEDEPSVDSEETTDEDHAILAAEFGRLTVAIAEYLTLDDCLKLVKFFNIPLPDCDIVLRVSMIESPGMKFLDVLKKRKFINMFDVTNLQKALAWLNMEVVNHVLVAPYQEKIDKEKYELYKVEEMYTWEEVNAAKGLSAQRQIRDSQTSRIDGTKPEYASQTGATAQHTEGGDEGRGSSLGERHHHQLYTECSIGREGGTIQSANVSLTVPPDALHESHVIALSVMNESPFPLDREVDTARMTPLIKLEPLGLTFKKSLQLNIPHSALISRPEHYDVIIYLGEITNNKEDLSDSIRWTEDRFIPRLLKEKSVTVAIQCLSYLSASLVSQISAPPLYIVRAVPFVDWIKHTDDEIVLTICFCGDNDSEYNMLLSDYNTKLPLEQYSTIQLCRHPERDEDDAGFLSVIVTSHNNTYVPYADQAVKQFSVHHLCTASRVFHQFRLQKNKEIDGDDVQVLLTFSQAESTSTKIFMKARIKDLMISQESEDFLTGSVSTALELYDELKANISSMLENYHCIQLATYFELTPAETEIVTIDASPGRRLMEILDEREMIMPQKIFGLYHGLKVCHLDKIARLVSEYIEKNSNETQQEKYEIEKDKCAKGIPVKASVSRRPLQKTQKSSLSSLSDQSVQTTLSSSCVSSAVDVKALTSEGYTEHEVVAALDISRNRPAIARKVLQFLEEQSEDVSPTKDNIFLHKEQYIDENGGEIILREANVHLLIPGGAVSKGSIVSLTMMTSNKGNVPFEGRTLQLSPVIKVGPEGAALNKVVTLRIPHCASETEGITSIDILLGFSSNRQEIQWRKRKQHEPAPSLKKDHFEVHLQTFCVVSLNIDVDYKKPLGKKLRVLPLINRVENPTDDLILTLWIYNDDDTEHMNLLHEEINVRCKMQLHDFKRFILKGSEKDREVYVKSGSNKINSHGNTRMKKVPSQTLWYNTKHAVEFRFQNKEVISDISFRLKLCSRQVLRTAVDLQFDVEITLSELLQKPQGSIRALNTTQEPHHVQNTSSNMHTDQTITNVGGTMCISGTDVRLKILPNSLPKGVEQTRIRMEIITGRLLWNQPVNSFASNSSVVVELLPNHLQLQRCALLTLPHCLKLKTTSHNVVKVFVSHHSEESKPFWEEKPQLDYQIDDNAVTLHLDTFCWVKYEIDDEVVEAKKIQVFAARPDISQEDETTKVELGYHPDLPGAGEILRNNEDLVKVEKKPFLFVREGNADLEIVGSHIEPAYWEFCKNGENVKKISFRMIAASVEKSRPFFLRRINIGTSYCEFQVSQASQASEIVELSLSLKPVGGVPAPTSRAEYNAMEDKMLDCFMFLKRNLVNDWKDVGRYLEVPEAELSRFSRDINIGESIFQMLLYWQRKNASEASTERLVKALKRLNRKDLIEKITEILN